MRGRGGARHFGHQPLVCLFLVLFFLPFFFLFPAVFGSGELSNRRAPGFSLPDKNMTQHDPQDYLGKAVLVEFMQTNCPHCIKFSGILEQAKAKYKDQIEVMSIVTMPDTMQQVQTYIQNHSITSPIL